MRRLQMRKIAEALRLRAAGLTTRKIAASLNVSQSTVSEYLKRAERAGLSWPLPEGIDEAALERRLFAPVGGTRRRGLVPPDWAAVHSRSATGCGLPISIPHIGPSISESQIKPLGNLNQDDGNAL